MNALQQEIIETLGVVASIDPHAEAERRIAFLADYLTRSGATGYVLGISGGVDSTVAGKLAQEACRRTGGSFTAVRLPYRCQADEHDAQAALRVHRPRRRGHRRHQAGGRRHARRHAAPEGGYPDRGQADFVKGNIKARLRMTAQYAVAGAARRSGDRHRPGGRGGDGLLHQARRRRRGRHPADGPDQGPGPGGRRATSALRRTSSTRCPPPTWRRTGRLSPTRRRTASPTPRSTPTSPADLSPRTQSG